MGRAEGTFGFTVIEMDPIDDRLGVHLRCVYQVRKNSHTTDPNVGSTFVTLQNRTGTVKRLFLISPAVFMMTLAYNLQSIAYFNSASIN